MNALLRPRRARFWVFINLDWVKLTLRQSHSLSHFISQPTEEGYHHEATTWTFEGRLVTREWTDGGRDCDGYIERADRSVCHLEDLHAEPAYDEGTLSAYHNHRHIHCPCWEVSDTSFFDEFAEAAGY